MGRNEIMERYMNDHEIASLLSLFSDANVIEYNDVVFKNNRYEIIQQMMCDFDCDADVWVVER